MSPLDAFFYKDNFYAKLRLTEIIFAKLYILNKSQERWKATKMWRVALIFFFSGHCLFAC